MDYSNTSGSLKEKKTMDANTVWQWRIMHVKKYSRRPEPFHYSKKIGLDFNVASNTQKKMDLQLMTNGVILEVCDFAKTVNKSERHFITSILENSFDLGLENEQQRADFTARILHKVKDLIRNPPKDRHEVFTLFETSSEPEFSSNNGLNMASTERKAESFLLEMEGTDDSEPEDEFKCTRCSTKEYGKTDCLSEDMDEAHGDGNEQENELKCSGFTQSEEELKDEDLPPLFPCCEKIGLKLEGGSKQSLDPGLLTKGVMLELVHFTRVLTASYKPIVLSVLEHNFDLNLKSQRVKNQIWFKISDLLKKRKRLITTGGKITPEFKNELFSFQTKPFKRPRGSALSNMGSPQYKVKEVTTQEKGALLRSEQESTNLETNTHPTDLFTSGAAEHGHSSTFPVGESDVHLDEVTDSDAAKQDHLENQNGSLSSDIPRESESSCLGIHTHFVTTIDVSSTLPTVNPNVNPPFVSQSEKRVRSGGEEQTETPRNAPNDCDMEQEELETENVWKLRANRVKQILSGFNRQFGPFNKSKKVGIEFDVGFGPKQNISVDSLTNSVLLELVKFALAVNASQQDFIMEILEYNFDFGLQSQHQRNIFTCELMKRVRQLRSCEDAVKFSNDIFELSGPMSSVSVEIRSVGNVNHEPISVSKMEDRNVAPVCCPDSHSETKAHSQKSADLYPFCKEIGLKLHVNSRPNKKLDINKLTNGAMTEVTHFTEKLCGTFEEICLDILRHNLDLDLQSGDSELARNILARIPTLMEQRNLTTCVKPYKNIKGTRKTFTTVAKLDSQNDTNVDACGAVSSQAAIIDQNVGSSPDTEQQNEFNLTIWRLRASHIQQILSIPHEEHCPLYSYGRCKKAGIDFNVGSGVKQNLDPKLLTNGVMVEINAFATALQSATKYFITEILEYNFDLNLNNELDRSAFTEKTMTKIRAVNAHKRNSVSRMQRPFELPDTRCIQDLTCDTTTLCPKCYQDRNHKVREDESDPGHMHHPCLHTMTDTVSADANCSAQKPAKDRSSSFSTIKEMIMDSYALCKKIGLNVCVDKDQPKDKLDPHVLTNAIVNEVVHFAKTLSGTKNKILNDVLEHNFNISMKSRNITLSQLFSRAMPLNDAWFSDVFVIPPVFHKQPGLVHKLKRAAATQRSEMKETIKKRKLALQTKEERVTLQMHNMRNVKTKTNHRRRENHYPICTEIGLDLDVTSKLTEKNKLDLKLLTRAVMMEIHKFAIKKLGHSFPHTVFDILDYNFDLSSQYYRRWEFSIATASKVSNMVRSYCRKVDRADEVFKLPFVFSHRASRKFVEKIGHCASEEQILTRNAPKVCDIEQEEMGSENSYTCPLGESDLDSDKLSDSENAGSQDHLQNPKGFSLSSDIPRESAPSCLSFCALPPTTTDVSSTLPAVNPNVNPPFVSQSDERGVSGGEEQTETPRNAPNDCDMEQEELGTENMWKLRANRVKQILSGFNRQFGPFYRSKKVGIEFNVGFGPKQNISVDSLTYPVLLELAKFALAVNASQQDFIMEILEYNFDFGLQSQHQRNIFTCELMKRVRQLRSCEDAVKFSNEVFELHGHMPTINVAIPSVGNVKHELSGTSEMEECDVAPVCCPDSHSETKAHSQKSVDLYPFCKEIGLKLHVNSRPNKKLVINKLTNGAMTEVTNFTEKLCGTFEEICLDVLRHNLDPDLQSGDSELARNILTQIPTVMEQRNLSACVKSYKKIKGTRKQPSTMAILDCPSNPNVDACGAVSSQAAIIDQNVGSSSDTEHEHELSLKMWKLRANRILQILSVHEEHCPLYSYSRSKKAGIDFNVGSGVKQNLDPKLLTNGIMVEINAFATALQSATKYFITEILEYNFNLNLTNELDRNAFAQQTLDKIRSVNAQKRFSIPRQKRLFELPDTRCIQEPTYDKTTFCPKCFQDRNLDLREDESDPSHTHDLRPHTMTDTVSADANCTAQNPAKDPSSTFSTIEETIMAGYPRCKEIGLNLCVDKDQPKDKLDTHVLTRGMMNEVVRFAKQLCGTKSKVVNAVVEHNFHIGIQSKDVDPARLFHRAKARKDGGLAWFDEVFVIQPVSHRQPGHVCKANETAAMQKSEMMETIKQRKLALQTKEEKATLPIHKISDVKPKRTLSKGNCYPICMEIGLDLDVTSTSAEKDKLDLNLLTRAVMMEIYKFATQKVGHYLPRTIYDILDYNFDLSSQHYRCWEFSIATASKVQNMVKQYRKTRDRADELFKLPFVFAPKSSQRFVEKRQNKTQKEYSREETDQPTKGTTDPGMMMQMHGNLVGYGFPLKGSIHVKEEYNPHYGDMQPELDTEEIYNLHYDDFITELNTEDVEYLVPGEPTGSLPYAFLTMCPNTVSDIKTEAVNDGVKYYNLAEPQGSEGHPMLAVCPNSDIKTEFEGVKYLVPVEAAASQEYLLVTIGQSNEDQEHMPDDLHHDVELSYTESEVDIKPE
ncbi:uncharacterized protein LOC119909591 [Micropterus salmoides]|uniref:uncharacterized protein LOC119909591 n=1 Tax=Micropterus salmoides TaxID=27706 RepID=UPI0018EB5E0D|nr:uncharacterized protein LOC119909591 [Micropterus salmoides]